MGFNKGHKKLGGRKKGVKNRNSIPLEEKARELHVDPFEILLLFAKGDWKSLGYSSGTESRFSPSGDEYEVDIITAELRLKAAAEASQYLYPKLKAIEAKVTTDPNEPIYINLSWADEDDLESKDAAENTTAEENQSVD